MATGVVTGLFREGDPQDAGSSTPYLKASIAGVGEDVECRYYTAPPPLSVCEFTDIGGSWFCEGPRDCDVRTVFHEDFLTMPTVFHHDQAIRTAGDVTFNSTSPANFDTATDLTVPAVVGDECIFGLTAVWENQAVRGALDAWTIVSGSPVNSISGAGDGVGAWTGFASVFQPCGGSIKYTVVSGDIANGLVTFRLRGWCFAATAKNLRATADDPLNWYVVNIGQ